MMGGGGMMGWGGMGLFGGLIGLILNLAILVGIVILVVWAVRRFTTNSGSSSNVQTPREILQVRYARGEITREQYNEMLSDVG